jgi:hypothetical protein
MARPLTAHARTHAGELGEVAPVESPRATSTTATARSRTWTKTRGSTYIRRVHSLAVVASIIVTLGAALSCNGDPPGPTCVSEGADPDCTPLYTPTYDEIFTRTLAPSCGRAGSSCHSSTGRQGGLALDEPEEAYRTLLARSVRPGDPACSEVVVRLVSTDPFERMPPGRPLDPGEQCAIVQWIASGAPR